MSTKQSIFRLSPFVLFPTLFVFLGAFVGNTTRPGIDGWYQNAEKAALNPPDWVFGVVWSLLYVMMGLAFALLWRLPETNPSKQFLLRLFIGQLIFNLAWSFVFFQLHLLWLATAWVAALGLLVLFFIVRAWPVCRNAALLLVPYLGWLCFALYLSASVAYLNP